MNPQSKLRGARSVLLVATLAAASASRACLWDSDTLRNEASNFPDLIDVATGRFERFPPLYYQMRFDRVTAELKAHPEKLSDYDDAGVACSRLGNFDSALLWMARKRKELKLLGVQNDDATYKLLSNEGTFFLQKWVKDGSHSNDVSDLDKSLRDLQDAIKINPNAHFGREVIQLGFVEWMKKVALTPEPGPNTPEDKSRVGLYAFLSQKRLTDAGIQKGLTGLIVLGAAWEIPDVFSALTETVPRHSGVLITFLDDRVEELNNEGIKTLSTEVEDGEYHASDDIRPAVDSSFRLLRRDADTENERRSDYMITRMKSGKHPDTDPNFWSDWKPGKRPDFIDPGFFDYWEHRMYSLVFGCCSCPFVVGFGIWAIIRRRRARATVTILE